MKDDQARQFLSQQRICRVMSDRRVLISALYLPYFANLEKQAGLIREIDPRRHVLSQAQCLLEACASTYRSKQAPSTHTSAWLIASLFRSTGLSLPPFAIDQSYIGTTCSAPAPGELVFWRGDVAVQDNGPAIGEVGLVLDNERLLTTGSHNQPTATRIPLQIARITDPFPCGHSLLLILPAHTPKLITALDLARWLTIVS